MKQEEEILQKEKLANLKIQEEQNIIEKIKHENNQLKLRYDYLQAEHLKEIDYLS